MCGVLSARGNFVWPAETHNTPGNSACFWLLFSRPVILARFFCLYLPCIYFLPQELGSVASLYSSDPIYDTVISPFYGPALDHTSDVSSFSHISHRPTDQLRLRQGKDMRWSIPYGPEKAHRWGPQTATLKYPFRSRTIYTMS